MPGKEGFVASALSKVIFLKIFKAPGIVWMQRTLLFQALLMEKVQGKMRKRRTFFVRHFIKILKVPGKVRMQKKHFFGRHFAEVQDTFFTYYKSFEL